jgi:hypothetical protein
MGESLDTPGAAPSLPFRQDALDALASAAFALEPPPPHERAGILRDEAALLLDGLLVRVARDRGALDVALGGCLASLAVGDRVLRLGFSGTGDYARERLDVAPRTAQKMIQLSRALRDRLVLAEAVRRGEVSTRKAEAVLSVARGEAEAGWVARAKVETVRALEAAVRAERTSAAREAADEEWDRATFPITPEAHARFGEALDVAGKLLGAATPRWRRVEAICQEYLGEHPVEPGEDEDSRSIDGAASDWLEAARAALEEETAAWAALETIDPVAAPAGADAGGDPDAFDPRALDARLRQLASMRDGRDEVLGHLAMLLRHLGLWRHMGFASLGHYAEERLGMSARAVEQRASFARRLYDLPELREAVREGRVSYEKARLVAVACSRGGGLRQWIDRAEGSTCIALRREVDALEDADAAAAVSPQPGTQMRARPELALRLPRPVARLLVAAFRAARERAGRWLTPGECLGRLASHFLDTWKPALERRRTAPRRALARDRGLCQVPGCSRSAAHAHHVLYRSHGGDNEPGNLVALCAPHHLHGIHRGFLRVSGQAPDMLTWELGVWPGLGALVTIEPGRDSRGKTQEASSASPARA